MKRSLQLITALLFAFSGGHSSTAQPTPLTGIPANSTNFSKAGNYVYFTAGDQLWRTDGTKEGTVHLVSGLSSPSAVEYHAGKAYFYADRSPSVGFRQLWSTNGDPSGTHLVLSSSDYDISIQGEFKGYVYFQASNPASGKELYHTDGTPSGTSLLKDINPGAAQGYYGNFQSMGDAILFAADDGTSGVELWKSDGTSSATAIVKDINPGPGSGIITTTPCNACYTAVVQAGGLYYFEAYTTTTGGELWVSDGTAAGTRLLKEFRPGQESTPLTFATDHGGFAFFFVTPPTTGYETPPPDLWRSGGTESSTIKLASVGYGDGQDEYHWFREYYGNLYFFNRVQYFEDHLWKSDGTTGGTRSIGGLVTIDGGVTFLEAVNNHLLYGGNYQSWPTPFFRNDPAGGNQELFYRPKARSYEANRWREPLVVSVGDYAFFADHDGFWDADGGYAEDDEGHYQLYQTDAMTTQPVRTIWGTSTAGAMNITAFNNKIIFSTYNDHDRSDDRRSVLWIYDPSKKPEPAPMFMVVAPYVPAPYTDHDMRRLSDGDTIYLPEWRQGEINIRFQPVQTPGSVVFEVNGQKVRTENAAPYALGGDLNGEYSTWEGSVPGNYTLTAKAYSGTGGGGTLMESLTIRFTIEGDDPPPPTTCTASGTILRELWNGVEGNDVSAIPVQEKPDERTQLNIFEGPTNVGTNYGARIAGYICPPVTGNYTFWIASNDHSELWLSTDDQKANRKRIAWVNGATGSRQWDKYASQRSQPVMLTAGKQYYIEALHKQGAGTDNIAVGWQLPDGMMERPIPGNRLSPFKPEGPEQPSVKIIRPAEGEVFTAPADIVIDVEASDIDGPIKKVEFRQRRTNESAYTLMFTDTSAPYSFTWSDVPVGSYQIYVYVEDEDGRANAAFVKVEVVESSGCTASGTITREYWTGVQGNSVSDIPQNSPPSGAHTLSDFEAPSDWGTNYGARIRGYVCAPQDGNYYFWIASNDHSELWLSTDENPANKRKIAYLLRATDSRQWDKYATQKSVAITLVKGRRYYIEALHKQGVGSDNLAVAWQLPDGTFEGPIPGSRLSPFEEGSAFATARMSTSSGDPRLSLISVYPNPAKANAVKLTISGYGQLEAPIDTHVEVINMTGERVFSDNIRCGGDCSEYLIELKKELVPGLYLIDLRSDAGRSSRRLVVE